MCSTAGLQLLPNFFRYWAGPRSRSWRPTLARTRRPTRTRRSGEPQVFKNVLIIFFNLFSALKEFGWGALTLKFSWQLCTYLSANNRQVLPLFADYGFVKSNPVTLMKKSIVLIWRKAPIAPIERVLDPLLILILNWTDSRSLTSDSSGSKILTQTLIVWLIT